MKEEYNVKDLATNNIPNEFDNITEYGPLDHVDSAKEYGTAHVEVKKKTKELSTVEKTTNLIKSINIAAAATGVTAVVVGAVLVLNVVDAGVKLKDYNINFEIVEASENNVFYAVDVGDIDNLEIKIYNDGYEYIVKAEPGMNEGVFEELESDTEYKLAVCDKGKVVDEVKVKTYEYVESFATAIEDITVDYECKCNVDGYFHFKINYEDNYGAYYNFEAYLMDEYENTSYCSFSYPYNNEQIIDITEIHGNESPARFVVTCMRDGETYTLIEVDVYI